MQTTPSNLDKVGTYMMMPFVDYNSFNTLVPHRLVPKHKILGPNNSTCNWILDFLTGRPLVVRMGSLASSKLTLRTAAHQGYVLRRLLYETASRRSTPPFTSMNEVERVSNFKFLGVHIRDDVPWSLTVKTAFTA